MTLYVNFNVKYRQRGDRTAVGRLIAPATKFVGHTLMSWRNSFITVLILSAPLPALAEEMPDMIMSWKAPEEFERARDKLRAAPTLGELLERGVEKAYSKCLAILGEPELCQCMTKRIPLKFDFLCYTRVAEEQAESTLKRPR